MTKLSGTACFDTDLPEGGAGRRPGTSVVSSASMSALHTSSLRDYTPASRSENQDSLQVAFLGNFVAPAFCSFSLEPGFLFLLLLLSFFSLPFYNLCFRAILQGKIFPFQIYT